jgi:hypothetical protein
MIGYAAITSMNQEYYNHCGRSMLGSFKRHWSHLLPLYVYNEDNFHVKIKTVSCLGWNLGKEYQKFQDRHSNEKIKTFAKKGFSIIDAMQNLKCEKLIWLDADTVIQTAIPQQLLDLISPSDTLSTHFSVWHQDGNTEYHSCETGFFILNKTHPGFEDFCSTYKDIYHNDKSENLRRFYDGEVYGKTVELMQKQGHRMLNLNPGKHKTPISRSVLSPYITHFKAGLKDTVDFSKFDQQDDI